MPAQDPCQSLCKRFAESVLLPKQSAADLTLHDEQKLGFRTQGQKMANQLYIVGS